MTKQEVLMIHRTMMAIARHKNRRFIELKKGEHTAMIPVADILAEFRKLTDFVKAENAKK